MPTVTTTIRINADHPSLPGHFPGAPMVPGVVLLAAVQAAFAEHFPDQGWSKIHKAKFENPAPIAEHIDLTIETTPTGARFVCRHKELQVATGRISFS